MKKIFILIVITLVLSSCGGKKERIIGTWKMTSYESNQKISNKEEYQKAINQLIKTTFLEFAEDNTFKGTIWNDTTFGNWELQNNKLLVTDMAGRKSFEVTIKELGSYSMTLEQKDGDFIARMYFEKE